MAFKKGFDRHMWPTQQRMNKRKKLEIFLESVHVLDDFRDILTEFEYKIIYLKLTSDQVSIKELLGYLNDYRQYGELKEEIIVNFGAINEKVLLTIYRSGIDKILDLVTFEQNDYSFEIVYEGRSKNRERKHFPIHYHKGWHSHIVIEPEREPVRLTEEQRMKIIRNRVMEAQEMGGIHDSRPTDIGLDQQEAIERIRESCKHEFVDGKCVNCSKPYYHCVL